MDVFKAETEISIGGGVGVIAGAVVLAWLKDIAGCTRCVTLSSDAGCIGTRWRKEGSRCELR